MMAVTRVGETHGRRKIRKGEMTSRSDQQADATKSPADRKRRRAVALEPRDVVG